MNKRKWILWLVGPLGLSAILTLTDGRSPSFVGWLSYLLVCGLCALAACLSWRAVTRLSPPRWLALVVVTAFGLRLGLAVAFTHLLPVYGSGRPHQEAGYFYPDAYDRDRIAWEFGRSDRPLWQPSGREMRVDQYGGLLLWSAAGYRWLSPDAHRPLLVGLQAATASALTALFTWAFVSLAFGTGAAAAAAWIVALYPEAVLLGASQMREPFMGLGLALLLSGYFVSRQEGLRRGAGVMAVGAALSLAVSPPSLLVAAIILGVAWLWQRRSGGRLPAWSAAVFVLVVAAAFVLSSRAWEGSGIWSRSALGILWAWLTRTAEYEIHLLEQGSGMVQAMFDRTPDWAHAPMATAYGLLRPFLPAALFETSEPLARVVEVLRAAGWTALLPFLLYAPLAAPRAAGWRSAATCFAFLVWLTALAASFRGGADGWDNVRYRAAFLVIQAAVAGWALAETRRSGGRWLGRIALLVAGLVVVFAQWYAGRYLGTPALALGGTLALAAAVLVLPVAAFVWSDRRRMRHLTGSPPRV